MYIIILDYSVGDVNIFPYNDSMGPIEDYIEELAGDNKISSVNNCDYMVVEDLKLQIH